RASSGFHQGLSWHGVPIGTSCCETTQAGAPGQDVGAFFEEGMWLRYNFQAPGIGARESGGRSENSPDPQNGDPDLAGEEIRFSFSTTKAPCILLYVSSFSTDFLAALVKPTGSLQIRYNLGGTREPYNIDVDHRSMANGQPHSVNITRRERTITLKVRTCLSHFPAKVILVYLTYFLHDSSAVCFALNILHTHTFPSISDSGCGLFVHKGIENDNVQKQLIGQSIRRSVNKRSAWHTAGATDYLQSKPPPSFTANSSLSQKRQQVRN
ncbi:hypothetical protein FD754_019921, partial [Muntiacus muntjak]